MLSMFPRQAGIVPPPRGGREALDELAASAEASYRGLVWQDAGFPTERKWREDDLLRPT